VLSPLSETNNCDLVTTVHQAVRNGVGESPDASVRRRRILITEKDDLH
jgi:hypothetical protein